MSAQIANNTFANIGRMFARHNVPAVYGTQQATTTKSGDETGDRVDRVSLSAYAPLPFTADFLGKAMETGQALGEGKKASRENEGRLREDRVFAAMTILAAMGQTGDTAMLPATWPGGVPVPTTEELEVARRRLAQRPSEAENIENPETFQEKRLTLWQKISKLDLTRAQPGGASQ